MDLGLNVNSRRSMAVVGALTDTEPARAHFMQGLLVSCGQPCAPINDPDRFRIAFSLARNPRRRFIFAFPLIKGGGLPDIG